MLRARHLPLDAPTQAAPAATSSRRPGRNVGEEGGGLRVVSVVRSVSEKRRYVLRPSGAFGVEVRKCKVVPRFLLSVLGDEVCPHCRLKCPASVSHTWPNTDAVLQAVPDVDRSVSIARSRRLPPPREGPAMVPYVAIENRDVAQGHVLSLPDAALEARNFKELFRWHCPSTSHVGPTLRISCERRPSGPPRQLHALVRRRGSLPRRGAMSLWNWAAQLAQIRLVPTWTWDTPCSPGARWQKEQPCSRRRRSM
jgi:hypothetical protein